CARATSTRWATRACHAMRAVNKALSCATTACTSSTTASFRVSVRNRSTCIRCALRRASCGARRLLPPTRSMLICGTTTLKPPEITAAQPGLGQLPGLPRDLGGRVLAEPWQASAFALAVSLSRQGHFSWQAWAVTLAEELKASSARGEPDDGSRYYHCWLVALE